MRALLVAVAAAAVCSAQPRFINTKLETRSAAAGLEAEFGRLAGAAASPAWIGYSVPSLDRQYRSCCGGASGCQCRLEGDGHQSSSGGGPVKLEGSGRVAILIRVESRQAGQVRVYSEDCELDAGGLPVHWLTDVRPPESVALLTRLATGSDNRLGDTAILAIAQHEDAAADRAMDRLAAAPTPEPLREKAIFWLGAARGRRGYDALRRFLRGESSDRLREKAVFALSINKVPEAVDAIIEVAKNDPSGHVRGQALFWLGQKAGKKAEAAIASAVADDPDTEVKKRAVFALSQLPKDEGVPLLIQTARTNRNPAVRKQAMFWLGQSQDPRALAYFEEVLRP